MDIDDYINNLIRDNEHLKNVIESLKKEIADLREERIMYDHLQKTTLQ